MNKENIRNTLKKQLFGRKGMRIRRSVDIEDIVQQQQPIACSESFGESYNLLEKIGEGAHSVVYKCEKVPKQKSTKSLLPRITLLYAVKTYRTDEPEIVNTIIKTFNIQRSLHDLSQVCRVYDLFIDEKTKHHYQVIEYCPFPPLQSVLRQLCYQDKKEIIKQLSNLVASIHKKGIAHRDLKPDNILVNPETLEIKLIDFGVSKRFKYKQNESDMWTRTGTIFYQAPEVFLGGGYDEKIDVWAIGVILFQMLCNKLPFQSDSVIDTIELITSEDYPFKIIPEFQILHPLERDLLRRILKIHPEQRLTAEEIPLHPWFDTDHHLGQSLDDSMIQNGMVQIERTQSSQIVGSYSTEKFQNLMESYEWGQRIHVFKP